MEDFIKYGQWVVVIISLLGITLVSSTKPKTRLSGYIVTALGRLSGAILFIFLDLYTCKSPVYNNTFPQPHHFPTSL